MNKNEIPPKKNSSPCNVNTLHSTQNDLHNQKNVLCFTEIQFTDWCLSKQTQELEQHCKIYYPEAVRYFRNNFYQYKEKISCEIGDLVNINHASRKFAIETYCQFSEVLLLISDKQYLDSITLSSQLLLFPKKIYKLLSNTKYASWLLNQKQQIQKQVVDKLKITIKNPQIQVNKLKTLQILDSIVQKMQKNLSEKMKLNFKLRLLQNSETLLKKINLYWRNCSEEEKTSIWCLGFNDIKKAVCNFLDREQMIDLYKIEKFVYEAQKLSYKQIHYSVFSWKLNQQSKGITQYMQLIFKQLKQRIRKRNREWMKLKSKNKKKKKIKQRIPRRTSVDQSSNETNQTNQTNIISETAFDINVNEIIQNKIQKDINILVDQINQDANLHFDNKELGYQRLRHIFANINVRTKVYGSCCVGLAIKNSDIDVAIDQSVLQQYYPYIYDTSEKISAFFEYIQCYFASFPWISNIKIIKSATIPIIKFTIDNTIQFNSPLSFGYQVHEYLNHKIANPGLVQIDLTIQTTQKSRKHLGIISTKQTQDWLNQISTLQAISIILKKQLAQKNLNETYYGGINTYTLLILIIAFIRHQKLTKQSKVSIVLEKVLKFYSQQFDEQKLGIDLTLNEIFYTKCPQKNSIESQQHKLGFDQKIRQLQIKDPLDTSRITTRNCYQFRNIKKIFKQLHQSYFTMTRKKIQQLCSAWNPKQNPFDQEMLMDWVQRQIQEKKLMRMEKIQ